MRTLLFMKALMVLAVVAAVLWTNGRAHAQDARSA
jgi:hypothetical protein